MIRKISFRFAIRTMIILLILVLTYHLAILTGLIPYEAVWGGRLETKSQMVDFEMISIAMNLFILLIISRKGSYINVKIPNLVVTVFLWIITLLFALNTVGNVFSKNLLEAIIFTPLTLLSAILCLRLAIENKHINNKISAK